MGQGQTRPLGGWGVLTVFARIPIDAGIPHSHGENQVSQPEEQIQRYAGLSSAGVLARPMGK